MRSRAILLAALGVAIPAIGCGDLARPVSPVRLRHDAKRSFTWKLTQTEDAPHPLLGIGGRLESEATVTLSCLGVEPDGSGQYEVTVSGVRLTAPTAAGLAVDTAAKGPVPGDTLGAAPVALSLLPRHAVVHVAPTAVVRGAVPDAEMAAHLQRWGQGKPLASQAAILRLQELLDPGTTAVRWLHPVAVLLPAEPNAAPKTTWAAKPPAVDIPAGRLQAYVVVSYYRPTARSAVLVGRGRFDLEGEAPADRPLDFRFGRIEYRAEIDLAAGTVVSWEETGRLDLAVRAEGDAPTSWTWKRRLESVESK